MILLRTFRQVSMGSAGALLLAACAYQPAFRAELPERLNVDGSPIAIIGDLQQTSAYVRFLRHREDTSRAQQQLIADLRSRSDELGALVIVGDLVYTGQSRRDWKHLDGLVAPFAASMPVLAAMGNHDYPCYFVQLCRKSKVSKGMLKRFPWFAPGRGYTVSSGDLELIFLDTETGFEEQGVWLEGQLADAASEQISAALVFFHRPAFTNSIDWGSDPNPEILTHIVPRLEQSPLPVIVFNGHIHGFEYLVRNGVNYVTTAGGGGPRGPMAEERPFDRYAGPDCPQDDGDVFRPFNYVLLRRVSSGLSIDVRGFCGAGDAIVSLDTIDVAL